MCVTSFVMTLGVGLIVPLLPEFADRLGLSVPAVGVVVSSFVFARVALDALGGVVLSRVSERTVAATGAVLVTAGGLLTATAGSYGTLVAARVVHGAGVSVFVVAALVVVTRCFPPDEQARAFSTQQAAMVLSVSLGPLAGAALESLGGIRLPFVFAALTGVAAFAYSLRSFPRLAPPVRAVGRRRPLGGSARRALAVILVVAGVAYALRVAVRYTLAPLFLDDRLHASVPASGAVLSVMLFGDVVGLFAVPRLVQRWGARRVLVRANVVAAGLVAVFPLMADEIPLAVVAFGYGVVSGAVSTVPAMLIAGLDVPGPWGMALFRVATDAGQLVGPVGIALVAHSHGFGGGFGVAAVVTLASAALAAAIPRRQSAPASASSVASPRLG